MALEEVGEGISISGTGTLQKGLHDILLLCFCSGEDLADADPRIFAYAH